MGRVQAVADVVLASGAAQIDEKQILGHFPVAEDLKLVIEAVGARVARVVEVLEVVEDVQ